METRNWTVANLSGASVVASGLIGLSLLSWGFLLWAVFDVSNPLAKLMMPMTSEWHYPNAIAVFVMWSIMMIAMMLPSAIPMIFAYNKTIQGSDHHWHIWCFVTAYIIIWASFSALATGGQWLLQYHELISPMLISNSPLATGYLLLIAGIFQFTPLKRTCLSKCRSPLGFLMGEWREGMSGAWEMGIKHGLMCLGCCWALMLLLFTGGVMNLAWVAILALAVLIEKLAPHGEKMAQAIGSMLIISGLVFLSNSMTMD